MQVRARLRLVLRDLWQTSIVSLVLLVLFNSANIGSGAGT